MGGRLASAAKGRMDQRVRKTEGGGAPATFPLPPGGPGVTSVLVA